MGKLNPLLVILRGNRVRNVGDYVSMLLFMLAFPFWVWVIKKEWRPFVFVMGLTLVFFGVGKEEPAPEGKVQGGHDGC